MWFAEVYADKASPWGGVALAVKGGSGVLAVSPPGKPAFSVDLTGKGGEYTGDHDGYTFSIMTNGKAAKIALAGVGEIEISRQSDLTVWLAGGAAVVLVLLAWLWRR